jgi:alanine racemase
VGNQHRYSTWVEIDLSAIENNVRLSRERSGTDVMAVVKANGYGHGAAPVSKAALKGGANWLGVARASEGLELRQAGLSCPILLMGYTPSEKVEEAIQAQLSMTVWNPSQVAYAGSLGQRVGISARLHLKIDTGMNRIGVPPSQALDIANLIVRTPGVVFEGIFTHFARADEDDQSTSDAQENLFRRLLPEIHRLAPPGLIVHATNSASGLYRSSQGYDLIRLGIAMYGLEPSAAKPLPPGFRPALSWKTVLSHVKLVPPGQGISYGHEYFTTKEERIGTIPLGYADGFRRLNGNRVLVNGIKVPVVGRVCMDQCMLQLDAAPEARPGDEVVIIGNQGSESLGAGDVARLWETINYEVVCGIGARVPRVYI